MAKTGFAFHVHHDVLMEFCTNYKERVNYIKEHKPRGEQEIRLRLFQLISPARLPRPLAKALEVYAKALEVYAKAGEAYKPQINELHKELCPDCPWDGKTIFAIPRKFL